MDDTLARLFTGSSSIPAIDTSGLDEELLRDLYNSTAMLMPGQSPEE